MMASTCHSSIVLEDNPQNLLSADFLLSDDPMPAPVRTAAYQASGHASPGNTFEGWLELKVVRGKGRAKLLADWFGYGDQADLSVTDLPPFRFRFVQQGDTLIPLARGPQPSDHRHWEFILEPGRVWQAPDDRVWSRASLPFALQERNGNCTHNGLLTFLFQTDGSISRVAYQVGSETCQYFQLDMWGVLDAEYTPERVEDATNVSARYSTEVASRLPVKPIDDLALDYPGIDTSLFDWYPPNEVTTFGFAIDGVHYSGGCGTRYGPYPYCEVLDLPSYSLAKSIAAGMSYMVMEQEHPGVGDTLLNQYSTLSLCEDKEQWQGVTLQHLLDMSTGNYTSLKPDEDEFSSYQTDFMNGDTHREKVTTACSLFPRKARPGTVFSYHSSDTYLAGTLMNAILRQHEAEPAGTPQDFYSDLLVKYVMKPLNLSPATWYTRRTYDSIAQPFAGYGLTLHADDVARLGLFLAEGTGRIDGRQVLDAGELNAALQRDPADTGITVGYGALLYNNGFWAYRTQLDGACVQALSIPFMSGYGGISVAIFPNQSVFYVFSDHGRFEWLKAAIGAHQIRGLCK